MKTTLLLLSTAVLLSACSDGFHQVSDAVIKDSQKKCEINGGIAFIENGSFHNETEYCGKACWRATGRVVHRATLFCQNGARFDVALITGEQRQ